MNQIDPDELPHHGQTAEPTAREVKAISVHQEYYRRLEINHADSEEVRALVIDCDIPHDKAIAALDVLSEFGHIAKNGHRNGSLHETRETFWDKFGVMERAWLAHERYVKNNGDRVMSEGVFWLVMGSTVCAGAANLERLITRLGPLPNGKSRKQAVGKCLKYLQSQVPELPLLEGQRGFKAREKMREARLEQVRR